MLNTPGTREQGRPLGFIGLGAMGGAFARNLVSAGYSVLGFDLSAERLAQATSGGVQAAGSVEQVVDASEIVITSLPASESFIELARSVLVPRARRGQLFIDVGTVTPPETRRISAALQAAGAALVDAPLSGGPSGAESGSCLVFAGGDRESFDRARPLLEVFGGRGGRITYCGPAGSGQVVKGVNQLAMGLGAAAYLEAVSFGINAGVDPTVIDRAVGGEDGWRAMVARTAQRIAVGSGNQIGVKFRELPYFLQEAREAGFTLPLTEVLYDFLDRGERVTVDDNRPAPAFFNELASLARPQD